MRTATAGGASGLTAADPDAVFALRGVGVVVGGTPVLRGLDFTAGNGEVIGVIGANGSGKSTLLRVLATLLAPSDGDCHVLGAPLGTSAVESVRPAIALLGHRSTLYPQLTLRENLQLVADLTGRSSGILHSALDEVGLGAAADRRADHCSQGMRRRAELARVLAFPPRLLLLDEAHAGLDPTSVGLVRDAAGRVRQAAGAAVVVAHDQTQFTALADRIVEVHAGAVRAAPLTGRVGVP